MAGETSRRIIAAMEVSLDGLIEGPDGEVDWIGSWEDSFDLVSEIDTLVLGGGAYPGYERYWLTILANPEDVQPLTGSVPSKGEVAYARFADKTPHVVLSRTLDAVAWKTTRIVRDVADIVALKQQPGKAIHAVGGASLVSTLMNEGLVDQLRLTVHPVVLGKGKALFKDVEGRHGLELLETRRLAGGRAGQPDLQRPMTPKPLALRMEHGLVLLGRRLLGGQAALRPQQPGSEPTHVRASFI